MVAHSFLWTFALISWSIGVSALSWPVDGRKWHGWQSVKHLFVFGDSYSTVGFRGNLSEPLPTAASPLGLVTGHGITSSNGPNWVEFLTLRYNESLVLTYDFAVGGATIDSDIVKPYSPIVVSMKEQVAVYLANYSSKPPYAPWTDSESLFTFFIGINDLIYGAADNTTARNLEWIEYANLVDQVYFTGARNFMFLLVPPINRSPLYTTTLYQAKDYLDQTAATVADWNSRAINMASNLTRHYGDATAFVFDTNGLFDQVLNNPDRYEQTKGYKNMTNFCGNYSGGTATWDTFEPECEYPVNEYFWLNTLHPTYPMHNATASHIAKMLSNPVYPGILSLFGGDSGW